MIAIVIIRLVAILNNARDVSNHVYIWTITGRKGGSVPTGHAPQSLDTSINITLTLLQVIPSIRDLLPLLI